MMLQLLSGLATVFLGALIGGRLASMCYVPRVTWYLLVGLLIGPSMSRLLGIPSLLTGAALDEMRIIADVALALILMNIGGSFELENLRRWGRRLLIFSSTEILVTFFQSRWRPVCSISFICSIRFPVSSCGRRHSFLPFSLASSPRRPLLRSR